MWLPLIAVGAVGMVLMAIWFHVWQDDVRDLMGVEHLKWYDYPLAAAVSLIALFTLVEIGQFIRRLVGFLVRQVDRIAPFRVSATIVVVLLVALTITLLNGVVLKFAMRSMNSTFASVNEEMNPNTAPRGHRCDRAARSRWCPGTRWGTRAASSSRPVPPSPN
ncbi:hypothetical protein NIIDMKKI_13190 [Mycobacterium kansasii]|uniref:Alpha/beta-hydrolase N-terminal domain-containing protein n=1 Tax=Mycobacterium kansasii TaxID=1768 RepID=A0A7G1I747_MYCKA|nr:hypothetical protein NIIDMKKI_13190 [Mycobacterium kansasii]